MMIPEGSELPKRRRHTAGEGVSRKVETAEVGHGGQVRGNTPRQAVAVECEAPG